MPRETISRADELASGDFYVALKPNEPFYCRSYTDPDDYVHEVEGSVILCGYTGRTLAVIGEFSLFQVDGDGLLAQRLDLYQACDIRSETFAAFEELFNAGARIPALGDERARSALRRGAPGLCAAQSPLHQASLPWEGIRANRVANDDPAFPHGAGLVVMKPFPLQFEGRINERIPPGLKFPGNQIAATRKLRAYYSRLGFKLLPRSQYMALHTLARLRDFDDG